MEFMHSTLWLVMSGIILFGFVAAILGSFAMLNKQSLLADTISHAALPGIALMFLLYDTITMKILMVGGFCAGLLGALLVLCITTVTPLKKDAALGFVLSTFFGLGIVLLTIIQKKSIAQQALFNKFFFGSAATILPYEITYIMVTAACVLCMIWLLWRYWVVISFDPAYATSIGMRVWIWQSALMGLFVITIVLGLHIVGVVLMSSFCIAPAVSMRQWTARMVPLVIGAGIIGSCAGVCGVLISNAFERLPTGPVIVVCVTLIVFISFVSHRKGKVA